MAWTVSTMFFFYLLFPSLLPRLQRIRSERLFPFALCCWLLQAGGMMGVWAIMLMVELEAPGAFQGSVYWVRAFPILRLPVFLMGYCAARERLHAQRSGAPPPVRGPLRACCPAGSVDAHASVLASPSRRRARRRRRDVITPAGL